MKKLFRQPKILLSVFLFLTFLTAATQLPPIKSFYILVVSIFSSLFFDVLFAYFRKRIIFFPWAGLATSLIIALLINPNSPYHQIVITCAIAMAFKNFLRPSNKHVFNPAAVGLFTGGIIFQQSVAWWGASFQNIQSSSQINILFFLILLLPFYLSGYKLKRFYGILSFILIYNASSFVLGSFNENPLQRLFDPTVIFFSIVMLPEPMTSPVKPRTQIIYGTMTAIIVFLVSSPFIRTLIPNFQLIDVFIFSLLISNAVFLKFRGV